MEPAAEHRQVAVAKGAAAALRIRYRPTRRLFVDPFGIALREARLRTVHGGRFRSEPSAPSKTWLPPSADFLATRPCRRPIARGTKRVKAQPLADTPRCSAVFGYARSRSMMPSNKACLPTKWLLSGASLAHTAAAMSLTAVALKPRATNSSCAASRMASSAFNPTRGMPRPFQPPSLPARSIGAVPPVPNVSAIRTILVTASIVSHQPSGAHSNPETAAWLFTKARDPRNTVKHPLREESHPYRLRSNRNSPYATNPAVP